MIANTILAAGALVSLAAAVPMNQHQHLHKPKRDVVWETKYDVAYTTVPVTVTHWLNPGESPPARAAGHHSPQHTSHIQSTVTVQPNPASSPAAPPPDSSAEAPSPSSYEAPPPPSSKVEAAPAPTTTAKVSPAEAPTSTWEAPTTTAPAAAPATSPASGGGYNTGSTGGSNGLSGAAAAGTKYTGDLTWYDTGLGACGITSGSSDHIVAISKSLFDQYGNGNSNNNPLCGKSVTITGKDGSPYTAKIVDRCTGCAESDLDLSHNFFNTVTNNGDGRVGGMHWSFD